MSLKYSSEFDKYGGRENYIEHHAQQAFKDPDHFAYRPYFIALKTIKAIVEAIGDDREIASVLIATKDKPLSEFIVQHCENIVEKE